MSLSQPWQGCHLPLAHSQAWYVVEEACWAKCLAYKTLLGQLVKGMIVHPCFWLMRRQAQPFIHDLLCTSSRQMSRIADLRQTCEIIDYVSHLGISVGLAGE